MICWELPLFVRRERPTPSSSSGSLWNPRKFSKKPKQEMNNHNKNHSKKVVFCLFLYVVHFLLVCFMFTLKRVVLNNPTEINDEREKKKKRKKVSLDLHWIEKNEMMNNDNDALVCLYICIYVCRLCMWFLFCMRQWIVQTEYKKALNNSKTIKV